MLPNPNQQRQYMFKIPKKNGFPWFPSGAVYGFRPSTVVQLKTQTTCAVLFMRRAASGPGGSWKPASRAFQAGNKSAEEELKIEAEAGGAVQLWSRPFAEMNMLYIYIYRFPWFLKGSDFTTGHPVDGSNPFTPLGNHGKPFFVGM